MSSLCVLPNLTFGEVHLASRTLYIIVVQYFLFGVLQIRAGKRGFAKTFSDSQHAVTSMQLLNAPIPTPFVLEGKVPFSV